MKNKRTEIHRDRKINNFKIIPFKNKLHGGRYKVASIMNVLFAQYGPETCVGQVEAK